MNKLLNCLLLCVLILISLLTGCRNDTPEPKAAHTVVLYFPYADGLQGAVEQNIADIKSAIEKQKGLGTIRVVMIHATNVRSGQLVELVYSNGVCSEKVLKNYVDRPFTDKENIRRMFNDVASYASTSTYSMIIGAHGSGWLPRECTLKKVRAFGGTSTATKANISTLDSAIVESGIKHIEYLCFDDCYMANIETAYQLRNAAGYIIASTSEIMNQGLPYGDIWTELSSTAPDYSAIVSGFHAFYTTYSYPYGALSVVDCGQAERAAELMRTLNVRLCNAGIQPSNISPQVLDGFESPVFFDMRDYTDHAIAALGGDDDLAARFDALYSDMVQEHSCTPYLWSDFIPGTFLVEKNCGLTISDPTVNPQVTPYLTSTPFWIATH